MSRIGSLPVTVPSGVDIAIDGQTVTVKGPKGELSHVVAEPITVETDDGVLEVKRPRRRAHARSLHGLTRTLINNMVIGVTEGYEKKLEIVGTGYRVLAKGSNLEFALGYSHSITVDAPEGITFASREPDPVLGPGHRQAARRRDRREHPQAAQARPVQGQGRPLRRRADPPQGGKAGK
jgi:large subunit ribosomal protein L6